ncbi:F-box protein SKIP2 [Tripterygium wilfordii]|uniref:F-box protein SKIP2 n=1 Tax=Tripterygium wilfordii TaxID=458696 RepID=A0A7J7BUX1_TRIWF|nr:F-box protein SKIP2 [Tripterygium wilfordii]
MGQSSSTTAEVNIREFSKSMSDRFLSSPIISRDAVEVAGDWDLSSNIPDECLAYVFDFLGAGDRKRCSVVCRRWFRVEGQNRRRLSLNAQSGIFSFLPSLFTRFDSVTKLALRCDRKSVSLSDDALILISLRCRNLTRLKLHGCRQLTDLGVATFAQNCKSLKKLSCGSCSFGASAMNAVLEHCTEKCKQLRKLHIDGWRTHRIGDEGLIAIANHCSDLVELVLIGVNATYLSLSAIAANCQKLERLALCGSSTIGDAEIGCIAAKCMALKRLCIKGCAISDIGVKALGSGCPDLVKVKVKKCRAVSSEIADWLQECRGSVIVNFDVVQDVALDTTVGDYGMQDDVVELPTMAGQVIVEDASTSNGRLALFRTKLGLFASRNWWHAPSGGGNFIGNL